MLAASLLSLAIGWSGEAVDLPPGDRVKEAVDRSLIYLQEEAVDWVRDRKCASCHHAPMMLWAVHEAKRVGFAVDDEALAEVTRRALDDPAAAKLVPEPESGDAPKSPPAFALSATYAALASAALPAGSLSETAQEGRDRALAHLVETQAADGSWALDAGRPPITEGREVATLMTWLALPDGDGPAAEARRKAGAWLAANPEPGSFQGRVLRLLVAARSESDKGTIPSRVDAVLRAQGADGGWAQAPGLPSDAFATGQALVALAAAGVAPDRPEIERARGFLVLSQHEDGSWPMASRPTGDGGKPAGNLSPITFAATAWATLGLIQTAPR